MDKNIDPSTLTDRELLLVIYAQLTNHLQHHDMYTKIALTAVLIGAVNFAVALLLIALRFGIVVGQSG